MSELFGIALLAALGYTMHQGIGAVISAASSIAAAKATAEEAKKRNAMEKESPDDPSSR